MRFGLLIMPLVVLAGCGDIGQAEVSHSETGKAGTAGSRQYALTGFDKISLEGPDDVTVRVGPAASVRAEGDDAVLDRMEIVVVDNELRVKRKKDSWNTNGPKGAAKVTVTLPQLAEAAIAGSGDMRIDRVKGRAFSGSVAGSGDLAVGALEAETVDLSIAGSGDITITGTAQKVSSSIAGSGNIEGAGLTSDAASITTAGSGDTSLGVRQTASVTLIGSGNATITGGAKCSVRKLGSGDARCG
ncbi:Putative auto-transporter adhesin, head GIN domain [Sphingomonas laterariae]|uniref:Putative auto-transporter adhesin, head GIN domain n=1 Tax=Edaphosphingomonas laterariae TaxID=861865 RepID=A0A239CVK7_9SPHN|nr:head GIN domain-containing protein [Sphingomonas laterariae]SNS23691.1 Putative auto-transporter adhesin, head GIN domain [Sphingomonas laterariae]